jgi:hypothetical protein
MARDEGSKENVACGIQKIIAAKTQRISNKFEARNRKFESWNDQKHKNKDVSDFSHDSNIQVCFGFRYSDFGFL